MVARLVALAFTSAVSAQPILLGQDLTANETSLREFFGLSVCVANNTIYTGSPAHENDGLRQGGALAYVLGSQGWEFERFISAGNLPIPAIFAWSMDIWEDTLVVGAPYDSERILSAGSVLVYTRVDGEWSEPQILIASDADKDDRFGISVAIWGETLLVGSWLDDDAGPDSGSVYVFEREGNTWVERQKLVGIDTDYGDEFGNSVSTCGNKAIIGAPGDTVDFAHSGSAYIFTKTGNDWVQQQKLPCNQPNTGARFGTSVSISGMTAVVGASNNNDAGNGAGSATVFRLYGNHWAIQQKLLPVGITDYNGFGRSTSICGNTIIVGATPGLLSQATSGRAHVFTRVGELWAESAQLNVGGGIDADDSFGSSVSVFGRIAAVGAPNTVFGTDTSGTAYAYTLDVSTPNAIAVTPLTTAPTTANTLSYVVEFDSEIIGFNDAEDVIVHHDGTSHSGVEVSGGPSVFNVKLNGISGDGYLSMSVSKDSDVRDIEGSPLANSEASAVVWIAATEGEPRPFNKFDRFLGEFTTLDTNGDGLVSREELGTPSFGFTPWDWESSDRDNDGILSVAELLQVSTRGLLNSADTDGNYFIALDELLRTIQFYNFGGYACADTPGATEDGFVAQAAPGQPFCVPHALDRDADHQLSLSELLRGIQLYNFSGYAYCGDEAEDGFCASS